MNRIDRLSAILIQLQSQRVVKAQQIADRFEISLRTVYRDVKALEAAGIPVIGEAGLGYSLVDGYRLPPVMFNREEAIAFLTAEKLVERLTDSAISTDYKSALYKIKAVLRTSEKDYLENMDSRIEVLKTRRQAHNQSADLQLLPVILRAISERKAVNITYFALYRHETSDRCIEPIGVFYLDTCWHLIAFCRVRKAIRDFRMDRISELVETTESFSANHPSLQEYLEKEKKERQLHEVSIRIEKSIHRYLDEQKYYHGFVSEVHEENHILMNFFTSSIEGFARWFMMFGDQAIISKPAALKEKVRSIVADLSTNLARI